MNVRMLRCMSVVAVVMVIASLGGGIVDRPLPVEAQEEQVVVVLVASPERVDPGECALVEWAVDWSGEWPVRLNDEPVEHHGHREVCPQVTTTYTLVVDAPDGPISRQVTVSVGAGPEYEGLSPEQERLPRGEHRPVYFQIVNPESIPRGSCATLVWAVGDAEEAFIIVDGEVVSPAGEVTICPEETARYELIVERPEGPETREIILEVVDVHGEGGPWEGMRPPEGPGEVVVALTTDPDAIPRGACASLNWEVSPPADWVILLDGELVAPQGSRQVCPEHTVTYELLVEAPTAPIVRHTTLHVSEEPGEEPMFTPVPPAAPTQPAPSQPGGPTQNTVDLAVTDLYADRDIQGTVYLRITNNGPATLNNARVEVKCGNQGQPLGGQQPWSHTESPWTINLSLKPGETKAVASKMIVDTSQYTYNAWCSVRPLDHTETYDPNNRYNETIKRVGVAPPPPPQPKPPGKPSGADVVPTDLYVESGALIMRITNNGPDTLANKKVEVTFSGPGCGPAREYILSLAPGETQAMDTYCQPATGKNNYTVTVKAKDFADPKPGNNTYSESVEGVPGNLTIPPPGQNFTQTVPPGGGSSI